MLETRKSNPVAASEEHDLAAGEFSTVGGISTDREVRVWCGGCPTVDGGGLGLVTDWGMMRTGSENASATGRPP